MRSGRQKRDIFCAFQIFKINTFDTDKKDLRIFLYYRQIVRFWIENVGYYVAVRFVSEKDRFLIEDKLIMAPDMEEKKKARILH